jgi:hypothetical protein
LLSKAKDNEAVLRAILKHLTSARATPADAEWVVSALANDPDTIKFFRAEALAALDRKATRDGKIDPVKRRKIFYALSGVARAIFGNEYDATKRQLDAESKAALGSKLR